MFLPLQYGGVGNRGAGWVAFLDFQRNGHFDINSNSQTIKEHGIIRPEVLLRTFLLLFLQA